MAADDAGNFVVAWHSASPDFQVEDIYLQRFNSQAEKVGPELLVNEVTESAQRDPWLAMDHAGNFVVVWQSFEQMPGQPPGFYAWDIKGRLFRAGGSPVGHEFRVNTYTDSEQRNPKVAFGPDGTFAVVWQSYNQDGEDEGVYLQRFAASAGDEPCAAVGGRLLCDTGRSGGASEIALTFGGRPGEVTLLGDADGDGRDELCAWFKGSFRCDLDHSGPPVEWKVSFGRLTDTPLLGDVDGDGRAEPCVRRKRQLRCDTAHDGGLAEMTLDLDLPPGAHPLFGNVDGL